MFLFSWQYFCDCSRNTRHIPYPYDEAVNLVQKSVYTHGLNGSEVIEVNQVRISSNADGTIR